MITFNFCPKCGSAIANPTDPVHCDSCGETYYRNSKPGVGVLIVKGDEVLLAIRGRDPYKGAYDIIGGFTEAYEHPEIAAIREAKEETGLDIRIKSLLGMYIDRYGEDGDYTLNIQYIAEITGGEMVAMDDVESLEWVKIHEAPLEGFQNTQDGLRDLQKLHKQGRL